MTPTQPSEAYLGCMGRINIDINDDLITRAMHRFGLSTPDEAVDYALRRLVGPTLTGEQMVAMEGTGWDGDLDQLREDSVTSL